MKKILALLCVILLTGCSTSSDVSPSIDTTAEKIQIIIKGNDEIYLDEYVNAEENLTVLDATLKAASEKEINIDCSGRGATAYIKGIGNLYEKDLGPTSGWSYSVNDVQADKGAGVYVLNPGDTVKWEYLEKLF